LRFKSILEKRVDHPFGFAGENPYNGRECNPRFWRIARDEDFCGGIATLSLDGSHPRNASGDRGPLFGVDGGGDRDRDPE
jgi:hypothetical protein